MSNEQQAAKTNQADAWERQLADDAELRGIHLVESRALHATFAERTAASAREREAATESYIAHAAAMRGMERRHLEFIAAVDRQTECLARIAAALERGGAQ